MHKQIVCPFSLVSALRSGTHHFYGALAKHPYLAWFSNITKKILNPLRLSRIVIWNIPYLEKMINRSQMADFLKTATHRCKRPPVENDV